MSDSAAQTKTENKSQQSKIARYNKQKYKTKIVIVLSLVYISFFLLLLVKALQALLVLKLDWVPLLSLGLSRLEETCLLAFVTLSLF